MSDAWIRRAVVRLASGRVPDEHADVMRLAGIPRGMRLFLAAVFAQDFARRGPEKRAELAEGKMSDEQAAQALLPVAHGGASRVSPDSPVYEMMQSVADATAQYTDGGVVDLESMMLDLRLQYEAFSEPVGEAVVLFTDRTMRMWGAPPGNHMRRKDESGGLQADGPRLAWDAVRAAYPDHQPGDAERCYQIGVNSGVALVVVCSDTPYLSMPGTKRFESVDEAMTAAGFRFEAREAGLKTYNQ